MVSNRPKNRALNSRLLRVLAADERERIREDEVRTDLETDRTYESPEDTAEDRFSFQRRSREEEQ